MPRTTATASDVDPRPVAVWLVATVVVMLLLAGLAMLVATKVHTWGIKSETLHIAAVHHPEEITPLIRAGRDVNELMGGRTPLEQAVVFGKIESVRALLRHGADPNLFDSGGATSAAVAQSGVIHHGDPPTSAPLASGHLHLHDPDDREIIFLLVDAGADPDTQGTFGETMLHKAVRANDRLLAERLLDAGANVNAQDDRGHTPLHEAAAKGHGRLAGLLLDHGADPTIPDQFDRTPGDAGAVKTFAERLRSRLQGQSEDSAPISNE